MQTIADAVDDLKVTELTAWAKVPPPLPRDDNVHLKSTAD